MIDAKKEICDFIKENGGFITYLQMKNSGFSYSLLAKMLENHELERDERGIYRLPNVYVDEYYILQYRFPKGVFSLETALWFHDLSLTVPFEPVMSFPFGTNTKMIKAAGIRPVILRRNYDVGIVKIKTPGGQKVRVYEAERTLVECLRPTYKIDVQVIAPAFKIYSSRGKIDYSKLHKYASLFKVEKKVQSYLEVLE